MILLTKFKQTLSIILYFINNQNNNDNKFVSGKEICKALDQFPDSSIKKNITKLVNNDILLSVSGPKGGFSPNPNISLVNISLAKLFIITEKDNEVIINSKLQNNLFENGKIIDEYDNNLNNIIGESFQAFINKLNNYKIKDIM